MPHQVFGRNHFILTGFGTYAEVDVFDSGLDDKAGADGAGFCAVNRIITWIDAGKVEVGTDGLCRAMHSAQHGSHGKDRTPLPDAYPV